MAGRSLLPVLCLCIFSGSGRSFDDIVKQPYGPLMCLQLCQKTKGCSFQTFNYNDLLCKVFGDRESNTKEKDTFLRKGYDCYEYGKHSYKGNISVSSSGFKCQRWWKQTPQHHDCGMKAGDFGTGETMYELRNFCRIPVCDSFTIPWCYTTSSQRWEHCDVPECYQRFKNKSDCYVMKPKHSFYNGTTSQTVSGCNCQRWDSPHRHNIGRHQREFATGETMIEVANYCRVVLTTSRHLPWCYTTCVDKAWQYCPVLRCQ